MGLIHFKPRDRAEKLCLVLGEARYTVTPLDGGAWRVTKFNLVREVASLDELEAMARAEIDDEMVDYRLFGRIPSAKEPEDSGDGSAINVKQNLEQSNRELARRAIERLEGQQGTELQSPRRRGLWGRLQAAFGSLAGRP